MPSVSRREFLSTGIAAIAATGLSGAFSDADAQSKGSNRVPPKGENEALNTIKVPTYDLRGRGPDSGVAASTSASKQGVVVLLVASSDEELINTARETLKKVISEGRTRVGMIVGDKYEGESDAFYAFSLGKITHNIKNPKPDDNTKQMLKGVILKLYGRDIEPLVAEAPQPRN